MPGEYFGYVAAISAPLCLTSILVGLWFFGKREKYGFEVENAGKSNCHDKVESERCVCIAHSLLRLAFTSYGVLSLVWGCCHYAWSFYSFGFWALALCVGYFASAFLCSLAQCFEHPWQGRDTQQYTQKALNWLAYVTLGLYELAWTFSVLDALIFWVFSDRSLVHEAGTWDQFLLLSRHGLATLAPLFVDGLANQLVVQCKHFWISQLAIMVYFGLIWTSDVIQFAELDPSTNSINWLQTTSEWQYLDCKSWESLLWYPSIQVAAILVHFFVVMMHRGKCALIHDSGLGGEEPTVIRNSTPFTATNTPYNQYQDVVNQDEGECELSSSHQQKGSKPSDQTTQDSSEPYRFPPKPAEAFHDRDMSKTDTHQTFRDHSILDHSQTTEFELHYNEGGKTPHIPGHQGKTHRRNLTAESHGTTNSEGTENGQSGGSGSDNDSTTLEVMKENNRNQQNLLEPIREKSNSITEISTEKSFTVPEDLSVAAGMLGVDILDLEKLGIAADAHAHPLHLASKSDLFGDGPPNAQPDGVEMPDMDARMAGRLQPPATWTTASGMPRTSHSLSRTPPCGEPGSRSLGDKREGEGNSPMSSQYRSINSPVHISQRPLGFVAKSGRDHVGGRVTLVQNQAWADHGMAPGLYFDRINDENVREAEWDHIRGILKEGELPLTITFWHGPVIQSCFDMVGVPVHDHGTVQWHELNAEVLVTYLGLDPALGYSVVHDLFHEMDFDHTGIVVLGDYQRNLTSWLYHLKTQQGDRQGNPPPSP